MAREQVLRSVHEVLTSNAALVAELGHTANATTIPAGARIVGDDVAIHTLPLPMLILGFEAGEGQAPAQEVREWQLSATLYAKNIFELARLLDALESVGDEWHQTQTSFQPLTNFRIGPHQRFDVEMPSGRILAVNVTITVTWVKP